MNRIQQMSWMILLLAAGCTFSGKVVRLPVTDGLEHTALSAEQTGMITSTLAQFPDHSQIAVALLTGNETLYFGAIRQHDTIRPCNNANSVFEIGSITKVFTTQLLMDAVRSGNIKSLDEPVASYLNYSIKGQPDITFRQLASHTSGLPGNLSASIFTTDAANPYKKWDEEKLRDFLQHDVAMHDAPGQNYLYSNVGMALLATILCSVSERDYEFLLQENICDPLHMDHTTTNRDLISSDLVQGYNWKGKPTENWDMDAMAGAGAILSTVSDLAIYAGWSMTALHQSLIDMTLPTVQINDDLQVALGWHVVSNKTPEPFLWHNGGTGGYKSSMAIDLNNGRSVVILTNIGATDNPRKGLIDQLCFDLVNSFEG